MKVGIEGGIEGSRGVIFREIGVIGGECRGHYGEEVVNRFGQGFGVRFSNVGLFPRILFLCSEHNKTKEFL